MPAADTREIAKRMSKSVGLNGRYSPQEDNSDSERVKLSVREQKSVTVASST